LLIIILGSAKLKILLKIKLNIFNYIKLNFIYLVLYEMKIFLCELDEIIKINYIILLKLILKIEIKIIFKIYQI